jgi:cytochrome c6
LPTLLFCDGSLQNLKFDSVSFDKGERTNQDCFDVKFNRKERTRMKRLIGLILLVVAVTIFSFSTPAWAGDAGNGAKLFSANCAACHMGGRNVVNPAKTLNKADLEKYAMNDIEAIKTQVTNGKAAMPAFGSKLSAQEIEDVATYVLSQSEKGW